MSTNRVCKICLKKEDGIRFNFGKSYKAEKEFHSDNWCDCTSKKSKQTILHQDIKSECAKDGKTNNISKI